MSTLYEITGDLKSLYALMESIVDENGEPREPNKKAILDALKDGILEERPGLENITKLFFKGGDRLPFVHVHQPDALVIR